MWNRWRRFFGRKLVQKEDYEKEYGKKPLGELVRSVVGMDMNAAKEAFSEFLNDTNLDSRQIYFCKSDCGIYYTQRNDERSFSASGIPIY